MVSLDLLFYVQKVTQKLFVLEVAFLSILECHHPLAGRLENVLPDPCVDYSAIKGEETLS
jgi:hypothetical protein